MTVFVLDRASASLRGELTRWMSELKPGVFVGNPNRRVADLLWTKCTGCTKCSGGVRIDSTHSEQGYLLTMFGMPQRSVVDLDGIQLVRFNTRKTELQTHSET